MSQDNTNELVRGHEAVRAMLFAPGSEPRKLRRLGSFGADMVVLDLEDAVAESQKTAARATVVEWLPSIAGGQITSVRANGLTTGRLVDDLAHAITADVDAVVVPKIESAGDLHFIDGVISALEVANSWPKSRLAVYPLIETARGFVNLTEIAMAASSLSRVVRLVFGSGDFGADLGLEELPLSAHLTAARAQFVTASRAAGLPAPMDGPFLHIEDLDGLRADTEVSRACGFRGRVVIHPSHVGPVQDVYGGAGSGHVGIDPRRIIDEFEKAEAQGLASIRVDGLFVDYPIYRDALTKL